jgi:glucosamine kinase
MHFIADSGATKTEGVLISENGDQHNFTFEGIHPLFDTPEEIEAKFTKLSIPQLKQVKSIEFYGTGCSNPRENAVVEAGLKLAFPQANINVDHDLMAAALCHNLSNEYVSCILGTGANAGLFSKTKLSQKTPSLGYILGDEGSGADIGKKLLTDFLYNKMSETAHKTFLNFLGNDKAVIIANLYQNPNPNRHLATLLKPAFSIKEDPYIAEILHQRFSSFEALHLAPYAESTRNLAFIGGVAYNFSNELKNCLEPKGWKLVSVQERPMPGLLERHLAKGVVQE